MSGRADTYIFMADRWKQWDLPDSRYVWLPIKFTADGKATIRWHDRWSLDSELECGQRASAIKVSPAQIR